MEHFSPEELEVMRALLGAEKDSLEEELSEHGRKVGDDWQGTAQGFASDEADQSDVGDTMEELAVNIPLVEELESRYKEVRAAIQRIADKTFGIDENTGEPIDIERLRANPAARTNI
jgi:DnaK suppressor protein